MTDSKPNVADIDAVLTYMAERMEYLSKELDAAYVNQARESSSDAARKLYARLRQNVSRLLQEAAFEQANGEMKPLFDVGQIEHALQVFEGNVCGRNGIVRPAVGDKTSQYLAALSDQSLAAGIV